MILKKSRYRTQLKPKTQHNKPEKPTQRTPLPPNLQLFNQQIILGNGFII